MKLKYYREVIAFVEIPCRECFSFNEQKAPGVIRIRGIILMV